MKIIHGAESIKKKVEYPVLTIGNFDGVHIGHRAILSRVIECARDNSGTSVVMIFDPHPRAFFAPDSPQKQISTLDQRIEILEELGIDLLIIQKFDKKFSQITAEDFIGEFLVKKIGIAELFISSKFRFGRHAVGGIDMLKKSSQENGFKVDVVENVHFRHTVVSSTFIKQSILDGEMEIARHMLGRPYTIHGEVYPDTQRGTNLLNTPTSNIKPENELIPALGIYASAVELDEKRYPAATYIGTRPTFDGHEVVIETHIIGFSGKLYGKILNVELYKKTRDDVKFSHLSDLLNQIRKDVEDVRDYFLRHKDDSHFQSLIWPE